MEMLASLLFPLVPLVGIYLAIRYGPVRNRWWKRETVLGFAFFVGGVAFLVGFVGPMLLAPRANQGPLLGILYTGPLGFLAGLVWGLLRQPR